MQNTFDDEQGSDISTNIATTFHNETIEEAVEHFVYPISLNLPNNSCIVAFLDETDSKDFELKELLEKVYSQK